FNLPYYYTLGKDWNIIRWTRQLLRRAFTMLSEHLLQELNNQMNFEFHSSQVYLALAAYCAADDLDGFANFFLVQAEEEKAHAMKFFNFINDRGARAIVTGAPD